MGRIKLTGDKEIVRFLKKSKIQLARMHTDTVNDMAFDAMRIARLPSGTLDRTFRLRNKYTQRAVRVQKAKPGPKAVAITGAVNFGEGKVKAGDYLKDQEFGNSRYQIGHLPTDDARTQKNSDKRVAARQKVKQTNFPQKSTIVGKRQAMIAIKQQKRGRARTPLKIRMSGKRGTQTGLYRINPAGKLRMIHNISQKRVSLKKRAWLRPAANAATISGRRRLNEKIAKFLRKF